MSKFVIRFYITMVLYFYYLLFIRESKYSYAFYVISNYRVLHLSRPRNGMLDIYIYIYTQTEPHKLVTLSFSNESVFLSIRRKGAYQK